MAYSVAVDPVNELLTPDPDGVTTEFSTSQPYRAGSVSIWLNGYRLAAGTDEGWEELGGTAVRMTVPPLPGDSLQARYEPT